MTVRLPALAAAIVLAPLVANAQPAAPGWTATQAPTAATSAGTATAAVPAPALPRTSATIRDTTGGASTRYDVQVTGLEATGNTMMLRLKVTNAGDAEQNPAMLYNPLTNAYVTDLESRRRAGPIRSTGGQYLASDMNEMRIAPGASSDLWVQFPAPPPGTQAVNLYIPGFPPMMNVPVSASGRAAAPAPGGSSGGAAPAAVASPTGGPRTSATLRDTIEGTSTRFDMQVVSLRPEANTLMLRVKVTNGGDAEINPAMLYNALTSAYVTDLESRRRAGPIRATSGQVQASDMNETRIAPGESGELWVQFPAPPPGTAAVHLYVPGFPPMMNVPVG